MPRYNDFISARKYDKDSKYFDPVSSIRVENEAKKSILDQLKLRKFTKNAANRSYKTNTSMKVITNPKYSKSYNFDHSLPRHENRSLSADSILDGYRKDPYQDRLGRGSPFSSRHPSTDKDDRFSKASTSYRDEYSQKYRHSSAPRFTFDEIEQNVPGCKVLVLASEQRRLNPHDRFNAMEYEKDSVKLEKKTQKLKNDGYQSDNDGLSDSSTLKSKTLEKSEVSTNNSIILRVGNERDNEFVGDRNIKGKESWERKIGEVSTFQNGDLVNMNNYTSGFGTLKKTKAPVPPVHKVKVQISPPRLRSLTYIDHCPGSELMENAAVTVSSSLTHHATKENVLSDSSDSEPVHAKKAPPTPPPLPTKLNGVNFPMSCGNPQVKQKLTPMTNFDRSCSRASEFLYMKPEEGKKYIMNCPDDDSNTSVQISHFKFNTSEHSHPNVLRSGDSSESEKSTWRQAKPGVTSVEGYRNMLMKINQDRNKIDPKRSTVVTRKDAKSETFQSYYNTNISLNSEFSSKISSNMESEKHYADLKKYSSAFEITGTKRDFAESKLGANQNSQESEDQRITSDVRETEKGITYSIKFVKPIESINSSCDNFKSNKTNVNNNSYSVGSNVLECINNIERKNVIIPPSVTGCVKITSTADGRKHEFYYDSDKEANKELGVYDGVIMNTSKNIDKNEFNLDFVHNKVFSNLKTVTMDNSLGTEISELKDNIIKLDDIMTKGFEIDRVNSQPIKSPAPPLPSHPTPQRTQNMRLMSPSKRPNLNVVTNTSGINTIYRSPTVVEVRTPVTQLEVNQSCIDENNGNTEVGVKKDSNYQSKINSDSITKNKVPCHSRKGNYGGSNNCDSRRNNNINTNAKHIASANTSIGTNNNFNTIKSNKSCRSGTSIGNSSTHSTVASTAQHQHSTRASSTNSIHASTRACSTNSTCASSTNITHASSSINAGNSDDITLNKVLINTVTVNDAIAGHLLMYNDSRNKNNVIPCIDITEQHIKQEGSKTRKCPKINEQCRRENSQKSSASSKKNSTPHRSKKNNVSPDRKAKSSKHADKTRKDNNTYTSTTKKVSHTGN